VSDLQPQFVHSALARLRHSGERIFGSESHNFQLFPPDSEIEISAFEQRFRVELPTDYRAFLARIGNGGAGPGHGIFPLGEVDNGLGNRRFDRQDDLVGELPEPFPFKTEWNDLTGRPPDGLLTNDEDLYWQSLRNFENRYFSNSLVTGAIPISHLGCAIRIQLVVTGPQRGFLWRDGRSEETGIQPLYLDDRRAATFSSWYENWLLEALRGITR
jgi:hypothetical protein